MHLVDYPGSHVKHSEDTVLSVLLLFECVALYAGERLCAASGWIELLCRAVWCHGGVFPASLRVCGGWSLPRM